MQNDGIASAVADNVEDATADEISSVDGGAVGELHAGFGSQGSREVPFCVFGAVLTEKKDVVLCGGRRRVSCLESIPC